MFKAKPVPSLVTLGADQLSSEVDSQYDHLCLTSLASREVCPAERKI